jgi:hypothetical protein
MLEALPGCDVLFAGDSVMAMMWYQPIIPPSPPSCSHPPQHTHMLFARTVLDPTRRSLLFRERPRCLDSSRRSSQAVNRPPDAFAQLARTSRTRELVSLVYGREAAACALVRRGWELRKRDSRLMVLAPATADATSADRQCKEVRTLR